MDPRTLTNYPNGVISMGVPVIGGGGGDVGRTWSPFAQSAQGYWFVNAGAGAQTAAGDGTYASPFTTMAQAFAVVGSNDVVVAVGNIREQLVAPTGIFNVRIIGAGTRPRNADAHTSNNGYSACTWRAPASGGTAAQATLRLLQQGWMIENILFNMLDANSAGIEIVRNAASGDSERDASHAQILGCRFAGAGIGIRGAATSFTENPFNVEIAGCKFNGCTYGIYAQSAQPNSWSIHDNEIIGCTNGIFAKFQATMIYRNLLVGFTAAASSGGIDLTGGVAGNVVTLNYLSGTYSNAGGYVAAGGGDEWAGNMNVISGGWTAADPA